MLLTFLFLFTLMPEFNFTAKAEETPSPLGTSATIAGSIMSAAGLGDDWTPTNDKGLMKQYKDGLYEITLDFKDAKADGEYKAAINRSWNESYGKDGQNKTINIPANSKVTFRFNSRTKEVYDSINDADKFKTSATLAGTLGQAGGEDWNPKDSKFDLDYIGGGFYKKTFTLKKGEYDYKAAYDHKWSNGEVGDNGKLSLSEDKEVTFIANPLLNLCKNSIDNPELFKNISLVGTVRGGNKDWDQTAKGYEFSNLTSDGKYVYSAFLPAGKLEYKAVYNYSWDGAIPADNKTISIPEGGKYVVFVADAAKNEVYDSINDGAKVAEIMGVPVSAEVVQSPVIDKTKGTVTFNYKNNDASKVYVAGGMFGGDWDQTKKEMTKVEGGIWTYTMKIEPGTYSYKFVVDGNWIIDPSNSKTVDDGYGGKNSSFTIPTTVKSPVINSDGSVTFNAVYEGSELYLIGAFTGNWDTTKQIAMTKGENNVFTATVKDLAAGSYEYKFKPNKDNWDNSFADAANSKTANGNSVLYVPGILITNSDQVKVGESLDLTAKLLDSEGKQIDAAPIWSIKNAVDGVSIKDGKLTVASSVQPQDIVIQASKDNYKAEKTIKIVKTMYTYTINYYRYDGKQQSDWNLWIWEENKDGAQYNFTKATEDGYAQAVYTTAQSKISFITRKGEWAEKDGGDRSIEIKSGNSIEVWLVQGDEEVHYTKVDLSPKILAALMDSAADLYVTTSSAVTDEELNTFKLVDESGKEIAVKAAKLSDNKVKLTVQDANAVKPDKLYKVSSKSFEETNVTMRKILDGSKYYYSGNDLGLTYTNSKSTFKLWAPTAKTVTLALYDNQGIYNEKGEVTDNSGGREIAMTKGDKGVWTASVSENLSGKYYLYKLEFPDGKTNYAVDPYANAVSTNGQRSAVIDLNSTNPAGFGTTGKPELISPTDAVVYEMHVRDFSMDENSGITNKGKFTAFTEEGTTLKGDSLVKTGIDHLKELGITHVHLLPSYDYKTVNEKSSDPQYNWGYDPQNYNVPEGSYSTNSEEPAVRVEEFKEMVQALHKNGIRVVMDVVYNHTYETGASPFDAVVPGYFYRTDDTGKYTNGSGCGNEAASERPMVRKYIKDSVKYWAGEYGIDGFRFDLMGLVDTTTIVQLTKELRDEVDPSMLIYGEPWTGGSTPLPLNQQTTKGAQKDKGFAVFNDNLRGAIKGDSDGAGKGFATGEAGKEGDIVKGIKGAIDDFTNGPAETINYVTAHDNLNLWDKILNTEGLNDTVGLLNIKDGTAYKEDGTPYGSIEEAIRDKGTDPYKKIDKGNVLSNTAVKRDLLANGIVLTSQGIPFIQAGDEMLKTKYGDHNSYKSPDTINKITWQNKKDFKPVFDYYQGLIELRKSHPAFRMNTKAAIESNLQVVKSDGNIVVFKLKNYANGDTWRNIVVAYNANTSDKEITLPSSANWNVVVDDTAAGTKTLKTVSGDKVTVKGLSMMVLYDEKAGDYTPKAKTIELSKASFGINIGASTYISAVVRDQNGRIMNNTKVQWSSDNTSVLTVDGNGRITGKAKGEADVIAKYGTVQAKVKVYVDNLVPTKITITGSSIVYATRSALLTANVKDQFDQDILSPEITWTSSDNSIAQVSGSGEVTGISKGTASITAKAGNAQASFKITVKENVKRYVYFKYVRPDKDYDGWNIWVWNTGVKNDQIDFEKVTDDGAVAKIEIAPETEWIGFVLRKGTDWNNKDPYGADRTIVTDLNSVITKVTVTTGVGDFYTSPVVNGPVLNDGKVTFYYRDDALYAEDKMDTLKSVEVKVNGTPYDMTYNAKDELYSYTMDLTKEGTYEYTFLVTDAEGNTKEITDPKNTENGVSKIDYVIPDLNIKAEVKPKSIDYNENAVVSLDVTSKDNAKVKEAYLDLSQLGGAEKVNIDTSLMAQTISGKDSVTAGDKNIPVTVVDEYGNRHKSSVKVNVKTRQSVGSNDFDWDEARIYFMLTDRFNNGDKSNDDPDGENYDKAHLETYHGGDFKGVTEKLDYIKELGINTIWITPIVDNIDFNKGADFGSYQYGYHGYWAKNFESLDEHLGSLDDFKTLIDKAHERGIKIMLDVVLNHAGYGMRDTDTNTNNVTNYPTAEDRKKFEGMFRDSGSSDLVKGDLSGLPDFKTEEPAVRNKLIEWQTAWLNRAKTSKGNTIDYFRVDTVNNVESTTLKAFKNALTAINPAFKMIGEAYGASINDTKGQLRSGQMDSILDFSFKTTALDFVNGNINSVEKALEEVNEKIDNTASLGLFLGSHDEDGFLTRLSGTDTEKLNKLKAAAALQITSKGQPVIYYGEELGASGKNGNNMGQAGGNFSENRYDMPWNRLNDPVYKALHDHYAKLLNIRADYSKIFAKGTRTQLAGSDNDKYLVFERSCNNESVVVGINTDTKAKDLFVKVPFAAGTKVKDVYSGLEYTVSSDGKVGFKLPAAKDGGTVILAKVSQNDNGGDNGGDNGNNNGGNNGNNGGNSGNNNGGSGGNSGNNNGGNNGNTGNNGSNSGNNSGNNGNGSSNSSVVVDKNDAAKIILAIKNAPDKAAIIVNAAGNKKVDKSVFEALKGTNKYLIFKAGNSTWTFYGKDIKDKNIKDIDLTVKVETLEYSTSPNKEVIASKVKDEDVLILSFAENGTLPGKAKVKVKLDAAWLEGKDKNNIYIYYYNPKTKKAEVVAKKLKVDKDGSVEFEITHTSDYFVSDKDLVAEGILPKTGSMLDMNVLLGIGALSLGIGVLIAAAGKRKKESDEEIG